MLLRPERRMSSWLMAVTAAGAWATRLLLLGDAGDLDAHQIFQAHRGEVVALDRVRCPRRHGPVPAKAAPSKTAHERPDDALQTVGPLIHNCSTLVAINASRRVPGVTSVVIGLNGGWDKDLERLRSVSGRSGVRDAAVSQWWEVR